MFNFDLVKQVYEHVTENNFCNMNLANESQLYTYFTKIQNSFYLRVVGEKVSYMSFKKYRSRYLPAQQQGSLNIV